MSPSLIGTVALAVPAILIAYWALWRRQRPVFFFALVLIAIGVGYLNMTGATADIGQRFVGSERPVPAAVPVR